MFSKLSNVKGNRRDKLNGTNRAEFAVFHRSSLILTDFRFSWKAQHFGGADFCRKPQETADFRRKAQEAAEFYRSPYGVDQEPTTKSLVALSRNVMVHWLSCQFRQVAVRLPVKQGVSETLP